MNKKILALGITSLMTLSLVTPVKAATNGVTVGKNTNPSYAAKYQATFVYDDQNPKDATSVKVEGGFQFFKPSEAKTYKGLGDNSNIPVYDAYHYQEGMAAAGSNFVANGYLQYDLKEVSDEHFELTLPLPGNQYFYHYIVEYSDGSKETLKDPTNLPIKNIDSDANWSLFYVGNSQDTAKGQEYIYPRSNQKGKVVYKNYDAVDGTKQPLGIYLPHNYDSSKTYKTIYLSHGGGGNEVEWMTIGSVENIMDNLIAKKEVAETIVVTMDNTYFNWDYNKIISNLTGKIIPFIEANYNVSKEAKDRAFCGLSMGSMTTNQVAKTIPEKFAYFGAFSGGSTDLDASHYNKVELSKKVYYLTAGNVDMAYNNERGISSIDYMKLLDKLGIKYTFDLLDGAHDWNVWRQSFTTFVKDYLWNVEAKVEVVKPKLLSEKQVTYVLKSNKEVVIKSSSLISNFKKVLVDDKEITKDNYTVTSGSTIVTLKPSYLETLSVKKHTVTLVSTDGSVSVVLDVQAPANNKKKNVRTGDVNVLGYFSLLLVSLFGIFKGLKNKVSN